MFIDNLIDKIEKTNNPSVVGLDPILEFIPKFIINENFEKFGKNLKGAAGAILDFNKRIINEVYDIVPCVKLQLGCYEMYGIEGMIAFNETIKFAKEKKLLIIADGKRNDIGSSAGYYSKAFLGKTTIWDELSDSAFDVDALTVNPYLGEDGIIPFLEDCEKYDKGIFVLVKTSNKSSGQFQDKTFENSGKMYEVVANHVNTWGEKLIGKHGYSSVGAVVGATYPEQASELRKLMKSIYFLVPGFGAQGGTAKDVARSFDKAGKGAIINASRSIMWAYKSDKWKNEYSHEDFALASRAEAISMRDAIVNVIK
jgi:orotidine-5'-phosphate decarboxylase